MMESKPLCCDVCSQLAKYFVIEPRGKSLFCQTHIRELDFAGGRHAILKPMLWYSIHTFENYLAYKEVLDTRPTCNRCTSQADFMVFIVSYDPILYCAKHLSIFPVDLSGNTGYVLTWKAGMKFQSGEELLNAMKSSLVLAAIVQITTSAAIQISLNLHYLITKREEYIFHILESGSNPALEQTILRIHNSGETCGNQLFKFQIELLQFLDLIREKLETGDRSNQGILSECAHIIEENLKDFGLFAPVLCSSDHIFGFDEENYEISLAIDTQSSEQYILKTLNLCALQFDCRRIALEVIEMSFDVPYFVDKRIRATLGLGATLDELEKSPLFVRLRPLSDAENLKELWDRCEMDTTLQSQIDDAITAKQVMLEWIKANFSESITDLKTLAERCPKSYIKVMLLLILGHAYLHKGNYERVEDASKEALNLFYDENEFVPCPIGGGEYLPQSLDDSILKNFKTTAHWLYGTAISARGRVQEGKDHMEKANIPEDDDRFKEYIARTKLSQVNMEKFHLSVIFGDDLNDEINVFNDVLLSEFVLSDTRIDKEIAKSHLITQFQTLRREKDIQRASDSLAIVVYKLNPTEAEPYLNTAILLNSDSPEMESNVADLRCYLANTYFKQAKYQDAEFNCREALRCKEFPKIIITKWFLTLSLIEQGKLVEAESLNEQNLIEAMHAPGDKSEFTLLLYSTRSSICEQQGDFQAAIESAKSTFDYLLNK